MPRRAPLSLALLAFSALVAAAAGEQLESGGALPSPEIDDDRHTSYRQVTWGDFLDAGASRSSRGRGGTPDAVDPESPESWVSAWLLSAVHIDQVEIVAEPLAQGEQAVDRRDRWRARAATFRVYSLMDKRSSGVVPGHEDLETLEHEQGHFDLAELCARRLRHEVGQLETYGRTAEQAQERLYEALTRKHETLGRHFRLLQQRYDGETDHAQKRRAQKRWRKSIDRWLAQEIPQTCNG
ncbi:MAG: hypothetical protein DWQ36_06475 [Acidobacteria bacterium]|nr:MAG: hypothetical protein DWQ36_06475 [Acidobacteriota bacterium]